MLRGDETPREILILAYGMEMGLQIFYETAAARTQDRELRELAGKLAQVEIQHERSLFQVYRGFDPEPDQAAFEAAIAPRVMEGGFNIQQFLADNAAHLQTVRDLLELAMMLETQALDLYLRFAHHSGDTRTRDLLFHLADAEKAHLASLGRLLEEKLGGGGRG
jgi:rubrerythrin